MKAMLFPLCLPTFTSVIYIIYFNNKFVLTIIIFSFKGYENCSILFYGYKIHAINKRKYTRRVVSPTKKNVFILNMVSDMYKKT